MPSASLGAVLGRLRKLLSSCPAVLRRLGGKVESLGYFTREFCRGLGGALGSHGALFPGGGGDRGAGLFHVFNANFRSFN